MQSSIEDWLGLRLKLCGLNYKSFTIVIYDRNDSRQIYEAKILAYLV